MNTSDLLFWNVDTQIDFVEPEGKLYVEGAEKIKPVWEEIRSLAEKYQIRVINTADFHWPGSNELSDNPDFISTFPPHCMANTKGAEYVNETQPENAMVVDWDKPFKLDANQLETHRNIVIRKDAFDIFTGNLYTSSIIDNLSPETVIVYGVTTNVCVNDAVIGLSGRIKNIFVVEDAIKELPGIPLPFENWKKLGVKMIQSNELKEMLENQ